MSSINKVIIIGNAGKDPEVRYLADGSAVTSITVATSEKWKDKATGEAKEATEWHRIVMYGKVAEIAGQYVKKGASAYYEGKLKTRKWTDKDGVDKYTTEVVCDKMQLLGGKQQGENEPQQRPASGGKRAPAPTSVADLDDDIPFSALPSRYDI